MRTLEPNRGCSSISAALVGRRAARAAAAGAPAAPAARGAQQRGGDQHVALARSMPRSRRADPRARPAPRLAVEDRICARRRPPRARAPRDRCASLELVLEAGRDGARRRRDRRAPAGARRRLLEPAGPVRAHDPRRGSGRAGTPGWPRASRSRGRPASARVAGGGGSSSRTISSRGSTARAKRCATPLSTGRARSPVEDDVQVAVPVRVLRETAGTFSASTSSMRGAQDQRPDVAVAGLRLQRLRGFARWSWPRKLGAPLPLGPPGLPEALQGAATAARRCSASSRRDVALGIAPGRVRLRLLEPGPRSPRCDRRARSSRHAATAPTSRTTSSTDAIAAASTGDAPAMTAPRGSRWRSPQRGHRRSRDRGRGGPCGPSVGSSVVTWGSCTRRAAPAGAHPPAARLSR